MGYIKESSQKTKTKNPKIIIKQEWKTNKQTKKPIRVGENNVSFFSGKFQYTYAGRDGYVDASK